jgi:hypothetical protein
MTHFVIAWVGTDGKPAQTELDATNARAALRAFRRHHGRVEVTGISWELGGSVRVVPGPEPVAWVYNKGAKPWPDLHFEVDWETYFDGGAKRWIMTGMTERGIEWIAKNVGRGHYIEHAFVRPIVEHARHQGLLVYGGVA